MPVSSKVIGEGQGAGGRRADYTRGSVGGVKQTGDWA